MICITCEREHQENFCPSCGERANIPKITFKSMFAEAFSTVTNMDKGFLLNLKGLTLNPRELITNYLRGKRKGVFNPISFLLLSVTIYLIVDAFMQIPTESIGSNSSATNTKEKSTLHSIFYEAGYFLAGHLKYYWLLTIFWLGIATKIIFGKYSYAEHLTISSFTVGYATLFGLFGLLVFKWVYLIINPIIYAVIMWILYQVFKNEKEKSETVILSIATIFLFVIQLFLVIAIIGTLITFT